MRRPFQSTFLRTRTRHQCPLSDTVNHRSGRGLPHYLIIEEESWGQCEGEEVYTYDRLGIYLNEMNARVRVADLLNADTNYVYSRSDTWYKHEGLFEYALTLELIETED